MPRACGLRKLWLKTSSVLLAGLFTAVLLEACATAPRVPPPSQRSAPARSAAAPAAGANSLWRDEAGLYEDLKARRVNDLVTINVVENISGSGEADTATSKKSTLDGKVTGFFGAPLDLNRPNLYGRGNTFSPSVSGSMENKFEGSGATNRKGRIAGTLTARVVDVMQNGNLLVESRKEITINNERQLLVLRGIVRPADISTENTVASTKVADAEIFLVGDGVVQEKQKPGWLVRMLDKVWPF